MSGTGVIAAQVVKSPAQAAADTSAPPPSVLTAPVERRVLEESVIIRGKVTARQSVDVTPSGTGADGAGKQVVTKLWVKAGGTFQAGRVLVEVSGRPIFALRGTLPVYRDLKPGATGDDVAQLQRALNELGRSTGSDRKGRFGQGTMRALSGFYASIGYTPQPAEPDGEALVASAQDEVTAAERRLEDVRRSARRPADEGERGGEAGAADKSAERPANENPDRQERKRAEEDLVKARGVLAEARLKSGPMLPASEVVFMPGFPARVDAVSAQVGSQVTGKVLTASTGDLVVQGYLQPHQKSLVRPGQKVEILSEESGETVAAKVAAVADRVAQAQPADGTPDGTATGQDGAGATGPEWRGFLMTVAPEKKLAPVLNGQEVRLTVQAAATRSEALVVPVSAVSSGADGRTTVTVLGPGDRRQRVRVTPGAQGDGFVEVRPVAGERLAEGDDVVVGVRERSGPAAERGGEGGE
ncbi:peptidoglycan-binding protein [Streptomyces sp. R302]|nr:peptidoglycan-binding protein [Streptomyces sp. R301]NML79387.1 peptidoglycan-binding protein [Streptomyces sp. R302]